MQTFLPYPSFEQSAACLDNKRLGKQRVECRQILTILNKRKELKRKGQPLPVVGYHVHPAVLMWEGFEAALEKYYNAIVREWCRRGFKNTMELCRERVSASPPWLGDDVFHRSHRSNLLRKDRDWYGRYGWTEPDDLAYVWPVRSKK